jgi:DNA-binding transcriptional regulator YiaG
MTKIPKFSAKQLRDLRDKGGFGVHELADACGVSPRTIENWCQGRPISLGCRFILRDIVAETKSK